MDITGVGHIYKAAPPYLNNRELPALMMAEVLARESAANPGAAEADLWAKAAAEVDERCEMVWFGLTGVSMPEQDALDRAIAALYGDHQREKAGELEVAKRLELVGKHVVSINNLKIDGQPVTDFDTFYRLAPKELVRWVCDAVHNCIVMSGAERKNFMPPPLLAA